MNCIEAVPHLLHDVHLVPELQQVARRGGPLLGFFGQCFDRVLLPRPFLDALANHSITACADHLPEMEPGSGTGTLKPLWFH